MSRVARVGLLLVASLSSASCGAIIAVAGGPPADHQWRTEFGCIQSNALPMLDLLPMGLLVMAQITFADKPTWIPPAIFAVSAVVGRQSTRRCRDAKDELARRNALTAAVTSGASISAPRPIPVVIGVVPETATVVVGDKLQLKAEVRASSGALVEGVRVTWHADITQVARVTKTGVFNARSQGTTVVSAWNGGLRGTAIITVVPR